MTAGLQQLALRRAIFADRNFDKASGSTTVNTRATGEVANADSSLRAGVGGVQLAAVAADVAKLDNSIGKSTKTAVDAIKTTSIGDKAMSFLENSSKTGNLVNGLLVAASAARIATAEDKKKATVHEGCAMGAMFGAEHLMKTKTVQNTMDKFLDKIPNKEINIGKLKVNTAFLKEGAKAVAFVCASANGFNEGSKLGDKLNGVA